MPPPPPPSPHAVMCVMPMAMPGPKSEAQRLAEEALSTPEAFMAAVRDYEEQVWQPCPLQHTPVCAHSWVQHTYMSQIEHHRNYCQAFLQDRVLMCFTTQLSHAMEMTSAHNMAYEAATAADDACEAANELVAQLVAKHGPDSRLVADAMQDAGKARQAAEEANAMAAESKAFGLLDDKPTRQAVRVLTLCKHLLMVPNASVSDRSALTVLLGDV